MTLDTGDWMSKDRQVPVIAALLNNGYNHKRQTSFNMEVKVMRLVSTMNCVEGMEIAKPIFTDSGVVLLGSGVRLNQRIIKALLDRNIGMVYVRDKSTDDLVIQDTIPLEMRMEATHAIKETFVGMANFDKKYTRTVNYMHLDKLQNVFKSVIRELKNSKSEMNLLINAYAHDNYLFSHSVNVTIYSLSMAIKLGMDDKKLTEIAMGGILHDIGKTKIPQEILNKPGKLTYEEYEIIKKHPEYGFEILRNESSVSLLTAHCAFQHHEKLDGTGYPRGIKGDEIHPCAKIMAIADVFDAITSLRSYRKPLLPHEALEIVFAGAGTHFDYDLVQTFRTSVASYPIGVTVKLNTGETGVVVQYIYNAPGRPVVRIIKDPNGQELSNPYELDLSKHLTLMIIACDAIMG